MPDDKTPEQIAAEEAAAKAAAAKAAADKALDREALGRAISEQVSAQVAQVLQNQPPPGEPARPVQGQAVDALGEVIEPYVQRGSARATLIAQMAADKADFYTAADPDDLAERLEYKEEVEKRALALAAAGRALPREDIFKHLKGGEKFEEFAEKRSKRKAQREQRARDEGGDHGAEGAPRGREGALSYVTAETAHELQGKAKLDEFLNDKEF